MNRSDVSGGERDVAGMVSPTAGVFGYGLAQQPFGFIQGGNVHRVSLANRTPSAFDTITVFSYTVWLVLETFQEGGFI